ncbi:class I SAM-dependent methyltransferase [Sphingobium sufflavum]|nr:class I SAM-dependent methyltransferase [Sphingobium sufflavum]
MDIGAGTGRGAAWFARQGHDGLAVEPVDALRHAGRARHCDPAYPAIRWLDDRLPALNRTRAHGPFDLLTLCAVWQHLDDPARAEAMPSLGAIAAPDSLLILSLRHGPGAEGRPVFPVSVDGTVALAKRHGFEQVRRVEADSVQAGNRSNGVRWTWLALRKSG